MNKKKYRKNKHQIEEIDTEGTWAISYGDMITLLLTFFIIFFSINKNDDQGERKAKLKLSLIESLSVVKELSYAVKKTAVNELGNLSGEIDQDEKFEKEFQKAIKGKIYDRGDYVILEFPLVSFFGSGQTEITRQGERALIEFSKTISPYIGNYKISIRAYTDEKKVNPIAQRKFKDNLELSALRGVSALRYLQKNGIPLNKMSIAGYGEMKATAEELARLPANLRTPENELGLARKIVIYIEAEKT